MPDAVRMDVGTMTAPRAAFRITTTRGWRWLSSLIRAFDASRLRLARGARGGPTPNMGDLALVLGGLSVVVASIWSAVAETHYEQKCVTARFRLNILRSQIAMYRLDHHGIPPQALEILTLATDVGGQVDGPQGMACGPYLEELPRNPFTDSATVIHLSTGPPRQTVPGAGWLYDPVWGEVWLNHADHLDQ